MKHGLTVAPILLTEGQDNLQRFKNIPSFFTVDEENKKSTIDAKRQQHHQDNLPTHARVPK